MAVVLPYVTGCTATVEMGGLVMIGGDQALDVASDCQGSGRCALVCQLACASWSLGRLIGLALWQLI